MPRRWINSIDLETNDSGALLTDQSSPSSFEGSTRTVSPPSSPQPIVGTPTTCRFVWVGARVGPAGQPENQGPCFIGDSNNQNIPIMPTNYEGVVIRIDDASKVYVRVITANDGVVYRIFA